MNWALELAEQGWIPDPIATWGRRLRWFVLPMALGNIAIAGFLLIQLYRLPPSATVAELLLRPGDRR